MKNIFETVNMKKPRRSAFDLSHEKKLSFNMGELIPSLLQEVVPGDHFKGKTETMVRMAPLIAPIMHRVNVFVHYFFVPNRIVWNEWEDFITGGKDGTTAPVMPTIDFTASQVAGKLPDYLGLPQSSNNPINVNALPFWAYRKIFEDYYMDLNLQDPPTYNTDGAANSAILNRAWEKDYFTSALPWPQRGPDVDMPVDGSFSPQYWDTSKVVRTDGTKGVGGNLGADDNIGIDADLTMGGTGLDSRIENLQDPQTVDGLGVTIRQLRESSALQRWLEKQARGGSRYIETILSHFGVKSSDQRLQRAEYLGGGKSPIVISEVLNTSNTAEAPQGAMAGHGISTGVTNEFNYKVEEHGYIMGIMSILPRTAYQDGIPRTFSRRDKTDYYWPEFANLGEQEVLNKEIYANNALPDGTFGYQQRYAEYKYAMDTVHGDFRSTLDFWHMGRQFATSPALNGPFIKANPTDRIFAVSTGDKIWAQIYNEIKAKRPMPYFSNPSML